MNLGAIIQRDYRNVTHADRDALTGSVTVRPSSYMADVNWMERLSQKDIPACSSHAAAHLKMILDNASDRIQRKLSPIFGWRAIKTLVKDGFAPNVGTNIESLFKMLYAHGMCDYELLPTDFTLSEKDQAYTPLTEAQIDNADFKVTDKYAITYYPTMEQVKDIVFKDKCAIILVRFDGSWFRSTKLETNGELKYGHFVCVYGYDEKYLYIIDSADDVYPFKKLGKEFKYVAVGSTIDIPDEELKKLIAKRKTLQQIVVLYRKLLELLQLKNKTK